MSQKVDLYTLIKTFSHKCYSAVIDTEIFIKFMEKNSQRENATTLNIDDWRIDTRGKILRGLNELVSQNKIEIEGLGADQKIIINNFYADIIGKYYLSLKTTSAKPFPDEKTLRLSIPENQTKSIHVESNLIDFLNEEYENPDRIIKLIFPENYGTGLTLEQQYPKKILEFAMLQIEIILHDRNELEFYSQRLLSRFRGQEPRIRNFINILTTRPTERINCIEEANEFNNSVWLFLCPLIKKRIEEFIANEGECTQAHIALYQASSIITVMNNYYQVIAINKRNKESALSSVYTKISEPPYIFTMADILQFKNQFNVSLNLRYTQAELENFLKEKMSITEEGKLPQLLKFKTKDSQELFIRKENIWTLCLKLLAEVQPSVKNEISQRWIKMLKEFQHEEAMNKESEFEDLVIRLCNLFSPNLLVIIQDKKSAVLQDEILGERGNLPRDEKFFEIDKPIPLKNLLRLRKEDILHNCKLSLPFWYSIGVWVKVINFFKYGLKKDKKQKDTLDNKRTKRSEDTNSIHDSAEKLAKILVPDGNDIDDYLDTVKDRWNQLLDKTAQKKLVNDVNAIIKAHLNHVLKFQKNVSIDEQLLEENAERIIRTNAALSKINNKNALKIYIKIFITKQLLVNRS